MSGADLSGADLSEADLSGADLSSADLSEADLGYADLSHAKGMSNEELEQETSSLGRATMPDGQRHKSVTTKFVTTEFEPALSYKISESWATTETTGMLSFSLFRGQEEGQLVSEGDLDFTSPSHVFDPSSPSEATKSFRTRKCQGVAIVVPETPEPRHLQAGPGERGRRIRDANRRDGFFYAGGLP